MKIITLFCIFIVCLSFPQSHGKKLSKVTIDDRVPDLEDTDFVGNVKKIIVQESYEDADRLPQKCSELLRQNSLSSDDIKYLNVHLDDGNDMEIFEFDREGYLTVVTEYDEGVEKDDEERYYYNAKKQLIQKIEYDDDGSIEDETRYEYTAQGKIKKMEYLDDGNDREDLMEYYYNDKGYLYLILDYNSDNKIDSKTFFRDFDSKGNWRTRVYLSAEDDYKRSYIFRRKLEYFK